MGIRNKISPAYILQNPVRSEIVAKREEYPVQLCKRLFRRKGAG